MPIHFFKNHGGRKTQKSKAKREKKSKKQNLNLNQDNQVTQKYEQKVNSISSNDNIHNKSFESLDKTQSKKRETSNSPNKFNKSPKTLQEELSKANDLIEQQMLVNEEQEKIIIQLRNQLAKSIKQQQQSHSVHSQQSSKQYEDTQLTRLRLNNNKLTQEISQLRKKIREDYQSRSVESQQLNENKEMLEISFEVNQLLQQQIAKLEEQLNQANAQIFSYQNLNKFSQLKSKPKQKQQSKISKSKSKSIHSQSATKEREGSYKNPNYQMIQEIGYQQGNEKKCNQNYNAASYQTKNSDNTRDITDNQDKDKAFQELQQENEQLKEQLELLKDQLNNSNRTRRISVTTSSGEMVSLNDYIKEVQQSNKMLKGMITTLKTMKDKVQKIRLKKSQQSQQSQSQNDSNNIINQFQSQKIVSSNEQMQKLMELYGIKDDIQVGKGKKQFISQHIVGLMKNILELTALIQQYQANSFNEMKLSHDHPQQNSKKEEKLEIRQNNRIPQKSEEIENSEFLQHFNNAYDVNFKQIKINQQQKIEVLNEMFPESVSHSSSRITNK